MKNGEEYRKKNGKEKRQKNVKEKKKQKKKARKKNISLKLHVLAMCQSHVQTF